ncbi:MAG: Crp/Fnr family transcriptional regulator [Lachnospiraceae bacterium]|nr:Crp/Fnr family transcriptional regulator [Lachnospiraceae bacterium]
MEQIEIEAFWRDTIGLNHSELLNEVVKNSSTWNVRRRDILVREREKLSDIPFLITGAAKSYSFDANGKEKVLCFTYLPGEPVTSIYRLDQEISSVCTIEIIQDGTLLFIPLELLNNLVANHLEAAHIYEGMLSRSLEKVVQRDWALASCTAPERYEWFERSYPGLSKIASKKDIAAFLNMSSESLSRILKLYGEKRELTLESDPGQSQSIFDWAGQCCGSG